MDQNDIHKLHALAASHNLNFGQLIGILEQGLPILLNILKQVQQFQPPAAPAPPA